MPMTTDQMSYEDMQQAVRSGELCGVCQAPLTVAWSGTGYILRCGRDITHSTMTRHNQRYEKELRRGYGMKSTELMAMSKKEMLIRVGMAKFPKDLTVPEKELLAQAAITYGLDPIMGEITIYQGRPYISVDGRFRKAQEDPNFDGLESRPATKQERADYQIPEGDYFFRGDVYVKNISRPFTGWGRVRAAEINAKGEFKPIDTNPQRMTEKRAEIQALRKAFHIPLPSFEDIGTPEAENNHITVIVDQQTGEIKDSPATSEAKGQVSPAGDTQQKTEPVIDLATLEFQNAGEFMDACLKNFKLQPSQVRKEVPMHDLSNVAQRASAWKQIATTYGKKNQ